MAVATAPPGVATTAWVAVSPGSRTAWLFWGMVTPAALGSALFVRAAYPEFETASLFCGEEGGSGRTTPPPPPSQDFEVGAAPAPAPNTPRRHRFSLLVRQT